MELLDHLLNAAKASEELPTNIVDEIARLADAPEQFHAKMHLIEILSKQISMYDPYADTGCFGSGATLADIKRTLAQILGKE